MSKSANEIWGQGGGRKGWERECSPRRLLSTRPYTLSNTERRILWGPEAH